MIFLALDRTFLAQCSRKFVHVHTLIRTYTTYIQHIRRYIMVDENRETKRDVIRMFMPSMILLSVEINNEQLAACCC